MLIKEQFKEEKTLPSPETQQKATPTVTVTTPLQEEEKTTPSPAIVPPGAEPEKDHEEKTVEVEKNLLDPSTMPLYGDGRKEPEDKDKTPKLANPVGFKRVKTFDCFADCMDIPNENADPVTVPYSPTNAKKHRNKRLESDFMLPTKKLSSKVLPGFARLIDQ